MATTDHLNELRGQLFAAARVLTGDELKQLDAMLRDVQKAVTESLQTERPASAAH